MAWQDRDWARLDESELEHLYGVPRRTASQRTTVWAAVAVISIAVVGFAWTQRPAPDRGFGITPSAIYGTALPANSMFGPDAVCTEYEQVAGRWLCNNALINNAHVPVIRATPYAGPCPHLKVDEQRWVCVEPTVRGVGT